MQELTTLVYSMPPSYFAQGNWNRLCTQILSHISMLDPEVVCEFIIAIINRIIGMVVCVVDGSC